jgi:hypothetical protein
LLAKLPAVSAQATVSGAIKHQLYPILRGLRHADIQETMPGGPAGSRLSLHEKRGCSCIPVQMTSEA